MQRLTKVKDAVPPEAVVQAHQNGRWMVVQGLASIKFPTWHMTIFPANQEAWRGQFALPANGKRGLGAWMEYSEFHITSPGGKHFFYTDGLLPLPASVESSGKSPPWQDSDWSTANAVVTWWFRAGDPSVYNWLEEYVKNRPEAERRERAEQKAVEDYENDFWQLYKNLVSAGVGRFSAQKPPDYNGWKAEIEGAYQGDRESLGKLIKKEAEESSRYYVHREPPTEANRDKSYEWKSLWIKGGTL